MRYLYGVILGTILMLIFIVNYKKNKDVFSPLSVFAFYQFIFYVPGIFFSSLEYGQEINSETLLLLIIFQLVFVIFVLLGYTSFPSNQKSSKKPMYVEREKNININLGYILLLYFIGLSGKIYTIVKSGGISYVINNPALAYVNLSSGSGYLEILKYFVYISVIFIIYRASKTSSKLDIFIAINMISIYLFLDLIYSRRSTTITIAILILFSINYFNKKIKVKKLFKFKYISLFFLVFTAIVVLPYVRLSNFSNFSFVNSNINIAQSITDIIARLSMVGRDIFTYNYFTDNGLWLGKSYINFPYSFVPSSIWTAKPAIDEGVYLTNLMNGIFVTPNQSFQSLVIKTSTPFTTQGILFANFGVLGIILGGFMIGIVYKIAYVHITRKETTIFDFVLYRILIFDFGLSVLYLFSITIQFIVLGISKVFYRFRFRLK